jgi:hypothetical protein
MQPRPLAARRAVVGILTLQVIPLDSFAPNSQEWWLPLLLAIMVVTADLQLLVRRSHAVWPWHLMIFAQGFNIISRIMMLWAHATKTVGSATVLNFPYLAFTLVAMAWSAFLLWYLELPEVRLGATQD